MDGARLADLAGVHDPARLFNRGLSVAVPEQESHTRALHGVDNRVAVGDRGRHRLVLHNVQARIGRLNAELRVARCFR